MLGGWRQDLHPLGGLVGDIGYRGTGVNLAVMAVRESVDAAPCLYTLPHVRMKRGIATLP